jgi:protein EFR3
LSHLFDHSDGGQIAFVMQAAMVSLDQIQGWENIGHCCWFAGKATEWTQYQFRDAVPNRLIERLQGEQDVPMTTTLHIALATMIITVFTSPIPLVMSTSDVISNLITLMLRRAAIDPADSLLLALTECIGALGTHVYYADQIHDLASELISRLVSAEATGLPGRERDSSDKSRGQALRALIAGLVGLMSTPTRRVEQRSSGEAPRSEHELVFGSQKAVDPVRSSSGDKPARVSIERNDGEARLTKRTKISPETWQDTLNLICDVDFSVRSDYASALLVYLESEISTRGEYTDGDGVRRGRPLAVSQLQQVGNVMAALHGDESTRFLHATHVYLYILATSPTFHDSTHSPSPPRSTTRKDSADITVIPATPDASREAFIGAEDRSSPARSQQGRLSFSLPTRTRKLSLVRRIISRLPTHIMPSSPPSATASDYRNIASILIRIHEFLPVRGLITGVPFLLALSSVAYVDEYTDRGLLGTIYAIREVISTVWLALGRIWDCRELVDMAEKVGDIPLIQFCSDPILSKALSSMPDSSRLPREREARDLSRLSEPDVPVQISLINDADRVWSGVDSEGALSALTSNKNVLAATAMDSQTLRKRLSTQWTAESAFRDCACN